MSAYQPHPVVMWEVTRACDLRCTSCTTHASTRHGASELTTYEAYKTIDQIATLAPRELLITGGDPLEREDLYQLVNYANRRGLDPAFVASPTSRLTSGAVQRLHGSGLMRIVFSIDGASAATHQAVRGVVGTFATTLHATRWATGAGMAVEINTLITRRNAGELAAMAQLLRPIGIQRWNLYFLVPVTAASRPEMLLAGEAEALFAAIDEIREREDFRVRVVEGLHYRRYRIRRDLDVLSEGGPWPGPGTASIHSMDALNDLALDGARGFVFISHAGDVRASEFLLFSAGNIRYQPLGPIYRASDLFVALRDPANLKGRCGRCEVRDLCGGSRARAWAMAGDVFADDPLCAYEPGAPLPLPTATSVPEEVS